MTVLPAKGEIRAEGGDTGCFEWSRKIWFENAVYGGRPNWRQDIRGGECLCAWKKICVEKYIDFFFFFIFVVCFRIDLDEGKDLRSFIKDIRVFRYNLKDIKDILV